MRAALLVTIVLAACHPHHGGGAGGPTSPYVTAYPALRWVPADATYVLTARHLSDGIAILRELTLLAGIVHDFEITEAELDLRKELGLDLLSPQAFADVGIDPDGGVAIFSQGVSPTIAIALSDPQRLAGEIEEHRSGGVAVEVSREGGVDVYTFAADRDAHVHWAIVDRWLLIHLEIMAEREPELAWFRAARAAGGAFANGPDLADAQARARRPGSADAPPPMIGVAKIPALRTRSMRLGVQRGCLDVIGGVGRAFVAAGVEGHEATGAIAIEVAGTGPADAAVAGPPGWEGARGDAAIQAEWNADLDRVGALVAACDEHEARDLTSSGLTAARVFVHQVDLKDLSGRAAIFVASHDNRLVRDALDQVPGLSLASRHRKVGAADVVDVSIPMLTSFSYALTATTATAAMGDGLIDRVVGDGRPVRPSALAHVELHPQALAPDVWDALLEAAGAGRKEYRARIIRRLRRWDLGRVDVTAEPGALLLTAHGRVH